MTALAVRRKPQPDRGPARQEPSPPLQHDPLMAYRFQRVRAGVQATLAILVTVAIMLFLLSAASSEAPALSLGLLIAAALGAATVMFVPWDRLQSTRAGLWCFAGWSVFDILLITLAIVVTGGASSELFYLYGLTTTLFAISYGPRGQAALLSVTVACYAGVLALSGWDLDPGVFLLRFTFLATLAFLGNFLSRELTRLLWSEYNVSTKLRELDELRSDFLSTISHELRTPLTAIGGFAVTLSNYGETMTAQMRTDLLDRIKANARDLDQLVTQLIDFGRAERGMVNVRLAEHDLASLVNETVSDMHGILARHHVEVRVRPGIVVLADEKATQCILQNLLSNAAKFSGPESAIRVEAIISEQVVEVLVQDEGIGIAKDQSERIFEQFYRIDRGDRAGEGTGIGLAIVRQFVQAQGGRVWVSSEPGRGSTFGFTLSHAASSRRLDRALSP